MESNCYRILRRASAAAALTAALLAPGTFGPVRGLRRAVSGALFKALQGKTVAYLPVAMNFDLTQGWFAGLKKELEPLASRSSCAIRTGAPTPALRR